MVTGMVKALQEQARFIRAASFQLELNFLKVNPFKRKPAMTESTEFLDQMNVLINAKIPISKPESDAAFAIAQRLGLARALSYDFCNGDVDAAIAIFHELCEEARRNLDDAE